MILRSKVDTQLALLGHDGDFVGAAVAFKRAAFKPHHPEREVCPACRSGRDADLTIDIRTKLIRGHTVTSLSLTGRPVFRLRVQASASRSDSSASWVPGVGARPSRNAATKAAISAR